MGIIDKARRLFRYTDSVGFDPMSDALTVLSTPASMATGTGLAAVLGLDVTGRGAVTEAEAMTVPPVIRAVSQYMAATADLKWHAPGGQPIPAWITDSHGAITPAERFTRTVLDLMFHRVSVWWVSRDAAGAITEALRLPRELYTFDYFNRVSIIGADGTEVLADQSTVILFKSLLPAGFLEYGADTVRHYRDVVAAIHNRGQSPVPLIDLHITEDWNGTPAELVEAQKQWAAARRSATGAVAITPRGIDAKPVALPNGGTEVLTEARNGVRLDIANFLNVDAALVDGASGRSMDYQNTLQSSSEFVALSLPLFLTPIAQRLSQPDAAGFELRPHLTGLEPVTTPAAGNTGTATGPTPLPPTETTETTETTED